MKYVNCNLCGADNWSVRFHSTLNGTQNPQVEAFRCTSAGYGEHTQIVQCHQCGYVYANPTWEGDELLNAYVTVEDETYVSERAGRELTFNQHLRKLEKLMGPAQGRSVLDVGAYIGVFVEVAQKAGWDAHGVEPSQWAVDEAEKRGLNIIQGTLDSPDLAGRQFDLVTMWDVIEHVEDPAGELRKACERLKPGGMIAVHTMDIGSPIAKVLGKRWPWLMAMHVHFFSKKTLSQMVEEAGFEIVQCQTEGRYLRLGYLATRLGGIHPRLEKFAGWGINKLNWAEIPVPINFGDLFTVYGKRKGRTHTLI